MVYLYCNCSHLVWGTFVSWSVHMTCKKQKQIWRQEPTQSRRIHIHSLTFSFVEETSGPEREMKWFIIEVSRRERDRRGVIIIVWAVGRDHHRTRRERSSSEPSGEIIIWAVLRERDMRGVRREREASSEPLRERDMRRVHRAVERERHARSPSRERDIIWAVE